MTYSAVIEAPVLAGLCREVSTANKDRKSWRDVDRFDGGLARAQDSEPSELRRFAGGLTADLSAVRAAFQSPWSSGQVEGQINRLKFLKRQMCGRANLDLLRARVLLEQRS